MNTKWEHDIDKNAFLKQEVSKPILGLSCTQLPPFRWKLSLLKLNLTMFRTYIKTQLVKCQIHYAN